MADKPNGDDLKDEEWYLRAQAMWRSGELEIMYPDFLIEPLPIDPELWGDDSTHGNVTKVLTRAQKSYRQMMREVNVRRTKALFSLYGIDSTKEPDCWKHLAQALIFQHVPGFKPITSPPPEKPKRGRPKEWSSKDKQLLVLVVDLAKLEIAMEKNCDPSKVLSIDAVRRMLRGREYGAEYRAKYTEVRHPKSTKPLTRPQYFKKRYDQFKRLTNKSAKARENSPLYRLMCGELTARNSTD